MCPNSLVPKERHLRKESNDSILGLGIVPKESHGCTQVYTVLAFLAKHIITYIFSTKLQIDYDDKSHGEHLVKLLIIKRVICGKRHT